MDAGANIKGDGNHGRTPLHCQLGGEIQGNLAVAQTLLDAGADPMVRGMTIGGTPLHLTARFSENTGMVQALVDAGADNQC